jgi:hypothetical protein
VVERVRVGGCDVTGWLSVPRVRRLWVCGCGQMGVVKRVDGTR